MSKWKYRDENGRVCSKCDIYKPWSEFNKSAMHANGYRPDCRSCKAAREASYVRDRQKVNEAKRRWYQKHKEREQAKARAKYKAKIVAKYKEKGNGSKEEAGQD
jgi:hypothetical protein